MKQFFLTYKVALDPGRLRNSFTTRRIHHFGISAAMKNSKEYPTIYIAFLNEPDEETKRKIDVTVILVQSEQAEEKDAQGLLFAPPSEDGVVLEERPLNRLLAATSES